MGEAKRSGPLAISVSGSATPSFCGVIVFYAIASWVNWYYYTRKGAERFDWGTKWGTWWDRQGKL